MHGHGVRQRLLAVSAPGDRRARLVVVWLRRFRCRACGATITILPQQVLRKHLYALGAIVRAWWLAMRPPLGRGLDDLAVYAHVGVDRLARTPETHRTGRRRWRSLARWAAKLSQWWPTTAVSGTTWRDRVAALLIGFVAHAGEAERAVVGAAVARHAGRGAVC